VSERVSLPPLCYRFITASLSRAGISGQQPSNGESMGSGDGGRKQRNVATAGIAIVITRCGSGSVAWVRERGCAGITARTRNSGRDCTRARV